MTEVSTPIHYVCTREDARRLVASQAHFWVQDCGCREGRGQCARSRKDVCLTFVSTSAGSGGSMREIGRSDVEAIFREAETKGLVARPFRDKTRTLVEGICFCCDDCCGYFLNASEVCDKGELVERTDFERCNHCGVCVDACFFKARKMEDEKLKIISANCYGCALCLDVCPETCVVMETRSRGAGTKA